MLLSLTSHALAVRSRPSVDSGLGHRLLLSDQATLLRGVSLSFDGGDPYGSLPVNIPSQASLNALSSDFGLNAVHLYLEGDSSMNPHPAGYNVAAADTLVQRTAAAGLYLIITIGNNGENGAINSLSHSQDFWNFYGPRYKNNSHVIYEAHNEPVAFTPNQWTDADWDNQVTLYNTIRSVAPDTLVLLGSFMGFAGDPRYGANYLASRGVDWSNAGFAHHGYESQAGIENAIRLMESSPSYPALLNTEFWPGDTVEQGYNSMYERHLNGWMQFQWLGADDDDLHDLKSKINAAGTLWTPDDSTATWPARGNRAIPDSGTVVGIFSRDHEKFLSATVDNGNHLKADLATYTGTQDDAFTIERIDEKLVALRAANGLYVSTDGATDMLAAEADTVGNRELFEWLRRPNGDVALRAYGGGGRLARINADNGLVYPNEDNGRDPAASFVIVTQPGMVPVPLVGDPYHGVPTSVPGIIQAEDYDFDGYHDATPGNIGGKYRTLEAVDIEASSDAGGGYNVGWLEAGDWMEYAIDVALPGDYALTTRVATPNSGGSFAIHFDGSNETGNVAVPNSQGWQNWRNVTTTVTLEIGAQIMRFVRTGSAEFNINYFTLTRLNLACDFNGDGICDCVDIDLLTAEIISGNHPSSFDLNGDGRVDLSDQLQWLRDAAAANNPSATAYLPGDADLSGEVDVADFNTWNANRLSSAVGWCSGDFNADGFVDISDFNLWNANKFRSSNSAQAVPEPTGLTLIGVLLFGWKRRQTFAAVMMRQASRSQGMVKTDRARVPRAQHWSAVFKEHRSEVAGVRIQFGESSIRLPKWKYFVTMTGRDDFDQIADKLHRRVRLRISRAVCQALDRACPTKPAQSRCRMSNRKVA